jgi:hypothetical protein
MENNIKKKRKDTIEILAALLELKFPTTIFREKLQEIPINHLDFMTSRIIAKAQKEYKWGKPPALWAFFALIDAVPKKASVFVAFLNKLDPACLKPDIVPLLRDKKWAASTLDNWHTDERTPSTVKKAIKIFETWGNR